MPGVVSLPHGFGHNRSGTAWRVAEAHAGVSANDLTDELLVDAVAGTVHLAGVPVTVAAAQATPHAAAPSATPATYPAAHSAVSCFARRRALMT